MSAQQIGSAFDLPAKSFELVKKNWQMFLLLNVFSIAAGLSELVKGAPENHKGLYQSFDFSGIGASGQLDETLGIGIIAVIAIAVLSIFINAMHTALEFKASQNKQPDLNELIDDGKKYWLPLFLQTIFIAVIIVVGLLLLVVPGVIAFSRLIFAPYIMLDKKLGVIDSMKASNELVKQHQDVVWAVIGVFLLLSLGATVLSAVPRIGTLLGTLFLIPFSLIIPLRYFELKNTKPAVATAPHSPAAS